MDGLCGGDAVESMDVRMERIIPLNGRSGRYIYIPGSEIRLINGAVDLKESSGQEKRNNSKNEHKGPKV